MNTRLITHLVQEPYIYMPNILLVIFIERGPMVSHLNSYIKLNITQQNLSSQQNRTSLENKIKACLNDHTCLQKNVTGPCDWLHVTHVLVQYRAAIPIVLYQNFF